MKNKLLLAMLISHSITQSAENKDQSDHKRTDSHDIIINFPKVEDESEKELQKMKVKWVAVTAIITALITGTTSIVIGLNSCNK